jgi:hypothetical protein
MTLAVPPDVDVATELWGANCGPAALAAAFGSTVEAVRGPICGIGKRGEPLSFKGYMGVTDMTDALVALGVTIGKTWRKPPIPDLVFEDEGAPRVVLVQWNGPWDGAARAAATYRHWIANAVLASEREPLVYDINNDPEEWIPLPSWENEVVHRLLPARATSWSIAWAAEVRR